MVFSYNWLQEYFEGKLPKSEKLAELLTMHAFEVENIEKQGKDYILDIAVLPNRAHDCLNHVGIAREIAAITKRRLVLQKTKEPAEVRGTLKPLNVVIKNSELVPRYAALVIEGANIVKSPKWLKEKLEAVGINSINTIVDITNYVMLELGQPLHAFDYDKIHGQVMMIRASKEGEHIQTLDDQTLSLPKGTLVIEDVQGLIDLAGIKGGKGSGISPKTKNIILQAANFDGPTIYKTKKQLGYTTQAADIYSHGIDPNLGMEALERALELLYETKAKGKVVQIIDIYPKKVVPRQVRLDLTYVQSLLGMQIPVKEIQQVLQTLGCKVGLSTKKSQVLLVTVPTRRLDLEIPEDLVEEVGRIHGYEKIPTALPTVSLTPPEQNLDLFWEDIIKAALKQSGFTEAYNYSFIGEKDLSKFVYSDQDRAKLVKLQNPVSEEFSYLRNSLLENLLKNIAANQRRFENVRIFELGTIFQQTDKGIEEATMLGGVITTTAEGSFYDAKGVIDFIVNQLGIPEVWYDEYEPTPERSRQILWQTTKCAEIKIGDQEIGFLGEISNQMTSHLKITQKVTAFHIDVEKLAQLATEEKEYLPPSKYPSVVRDIAVLVPRDVRVGDVLDKINEAEKMLVADVDLFDMYEGEEIPDGKKNLAFHIVYQSKEKTLTNREVDALHDKIIKILETDPGWEVRK